MTINITGTSSQYPHADSGGPGHDLESAAARLGRSGSVLLVPVVAARRPADPAPAQARRRAGPRPAAGLPRHISGSAACRVRTLGLERLPPGACIIVANHASYLDGPLLFAWLPPRFGFVIKKEASRAAAARPPAAAARPPFRGAQRTVTRAPGDARRILRAARAGRSGRLLPGRHFSPAARASRASTAGPLRSRRARALPVAPVAIRGTRHVLGGGQRLAALGTHRSRGAGTAAGRDRRGRCGDAGCATRARARIAAAVGRADAA